MERYCPKCFKSYDNGATTCAEDGTTLVGMEERNLVGETLDSRYKILDLVGQGGMGIVYKAEQEIIGRVVALKVLRREIVRDASQVKRFLTEAKAIASLSSRNTVTLYDFGVTTEGLLYYTMELLEGASLSELIEEHGPLPFNRAANIVLQACDSLAEAHDSGILHRDIKPENIFVSTERGGEDLVKVLDFGIAKLMGDQSMGTLTQTGMICGTPAYLAPEQALGNPAGESADLYSLAITFYEALSGKPPFVADTAMKLLLKHINDEMPALVETNPQILVPATMDGFLRKALAKDPADRYATVDAFRGALEEAIREHETAPTTGHIPALATSMAGTRIIARPDEETTGVELGHAETMITPASVPIAPVSAGPGPSRLPWVLGLGFILAAAVVVLVLWSPWAGEEAPPPAAAPEAKAAAPAAAPAPERAAVDPAVERARVDAEIEARVRAAEARAEERSKADQEAMAKAVETAAAAAAKQARAEVKAEVAKQAEMEAAEEKKAAEEAARLKAEEQAAAELAEEELARKLAEETEEAKKAEEARKRREARKAAETKKPDTQKPPKPEDDGFVTIPSEKKPKPDDDDGFVTLPE